MPSPQDSALGIVSIDDFVGPINPATYKELEDYETDTHFAELHGMKDYDLNVNDPERIERRAMAGYERGLEAVRSTFVNRTLLP